MKEDSDMRLVVRVRAGDRSAAEILVRRYLAACRAIALALVGNMSEAEDVCQDAFLAAMRDIDDCRDPARFRAWLTQIVRNRAFDLLRRRNIHEVVDIDSNEFAQDATQLQQAERAELRQSLLDALAELSEPQRIAILLHDVEGWKHREIAAFLELPPGTVRSHVHHARARLRELLTLYHDEDA
jgi:RNA polymerase sigma-70 factor (ECF subfamily)